MPSCFRFFVDRYSIGNDLEPAASRRNHLKLGVGKALLNLSRQTGGSRFVVSNDAVFDGDFHGFIVGVGLY
jgi:hypothetical protein